MTTKSTMPYQLGIYADFQGFAATLIEITGRDEIKVCEEFVSKASLINISKAIDTVEKKFKVFEVNISALKPLETYLDKLGKYYRCLPLDIASSVFLIACLCNDERLIIHDSLKTFYIEELEGFDIDITSHRLNALALAIGDYDVLNTMIGT